VGLRANALGFRGRKWRQPRPAATFRVALIGDSHSFGFGVRFADTAAEVAARVLGRRMSGPVEVLNFGVNGYNTEQELAVLRAEALAFAPDVVVLQVSSNDHEPASYADPYGNLTAFADVAAEPASVQRAALMVVGRVARWSRLYLWARKRLLASRDAPGLHPPPAVGGEPWPAQRGWMAEIDADPSSEALQASVGAPLRSMITLAKARGADVVLVSYADWPDYRRLLRRIAADERLAWLEIFTLFQVHSYPELLARFGLGWDPHLNATGQRRWGRALAHLVGRSIAARRRR
jgi:lysophospholipase L1-like esterase